MSAFASLHRPPSLSAPLKRALAASVPFEPLTRSHPQRHGSPARRFTASTKSLEDVFFRSLATASLCSVHARAAVRFKNACRTFGSPRATKRPISSTASETSDSALSKEDLNQVVDTYGNGSEDTQISRAPTPGHFSLARRLVVDDYKEHIKRLPAPPQDKQHQEQLSTFLSLLTKRRGTISLDRLWEMYQALPTPRLRHLPNMAIRQLLGHHSWVHYRHQGDASVRYLSIIEECAAENITVSRGEWNGAIAFVNKSRVPSTEDVQKALEIWLKMENLGIDASNVTFNNLFHVAIKAGRYALADTIAEEMRTRGLHFNRYFRTMQIWYAGVRADGDAVRQAFRDFVNANLIVDTTVMNCVISSLVSVGEPEAAEDVFARMKWLYEEKLGSRGTDDWVQERHRERRLNWVEDELRSQRDAQLSTFFGTGFSIDGKKEELQKQTPIFPDTATYSILIKHHAYSTGDFHRIEDLLAEMKEYNIRLHGSVYTSLFRGFRKHGGKRYTLWDTRSLENLFQDFLSAARSFQDTRPRDWDANEPVTDTSWQPRIHFTAIGAILRAFHNCTGYRRTMQVYQELKAANPELNRDEELRLLNLMRQIARDDSKYIIKTYLPI